MSIFFFNQNVSPDKGFIGYIDNIVIRSLFTEEIDVCRRYEVGRKNPNQYDTMIFKDGYDLFWKCDQVGPIISVDAPNFPFITGTMSEGCSESDTFGIRSYKNKIVFVLMDSDSVPRDQIAIENDANSNSLEGDAQLVSDSSAYRGLAILEWDSASTKLTFKIESDLIPKQVWDLPVLNANSTYQMRLDFDGEFASISIIQKATAVNGDQVVETYVDEKVVFKTNRFPLDFRVRGGVGWSASLFDKSSSVDYVTVENTGFSEYRSTPLRSNMPYAGVQVFPSETPPKDLVGSFDVSEWGGQKTIESQSIKVTTSGNRRFEGIKTNQFFIRDPSDIRISLDTLSSVDLNVFLYSHRNDKILPVRTGSLSSKKRIVTSVNTSLDNGAGYYSLYVTSSTYGIWNVYDISVKVPSVSWFARSKARDEWIPFKTISGIDYGGVSFEEMGRELQIKALSRFYEANINGVQIQPKELTMGNLVWPDEVTT